MLEATVTYRILLVKGKRVPQPGIYEVDPL